MLSEKIEAARRKAHGVHPVVLSYLDNQKEHWDAALADRAGECKNRSARDFLLRCAALDPGCPGNWEQSKHRFRTEIREPGAAAFRRTAEALSNALAVCRKALEGQPHLEFLFNAIADSPALMRVIVQSGCPEFRELFRDVNFDTETAGRELSRSATENVQKTQKEAV